MGKKTKFYLATLSPMFFGGITCFYGYFVMNSLIISAIGAAIGAIAIAFYLGFWVAAEMVYKKATGKELGDKTSDFLDRVL